MEATRPLLVERGRLIGLGRAPLSRPLLVLSGPLQPLRYPEMAYGIAGLYAGWSCDVAYYSVHYRTLVGIRFELTVATVDIGEATAMMVPPPPTTGQFFLFFSFGLAATMPRWSWQGILWVATTSLLMFVFAEMRLGGEEDTPRIVAQANSLAVFAVLLGLLAVHENQLGRWWRLRSDLRAEHSAGGLPRSTLAQALDAQIATIFWRNAKTEEPSFTSYPMTSRQMQNNGDGRDIYGLVASVVGILAPAISGDGQGCASTTSTLLSSQTQRYP